MTDGNRMRSENRHPHRSKLSRRVRSQQFHGNSLLNTHSLNQSFRARLSKSRCYCLNWSCSGCVADDAAKLCSIEPMYSNRNHTVVCDSCAPNHLINSLLLACNLAITLRLFNGNGANAMVWLVWFDRSIHIDERSVINVSADRK